MDIPYLVLIKSLNEFKSDEIIDCFLKLLEKIYNPKTTVKNHGIYEIFHKVVDYFPHHTQWINDIILIIKKTVESSSYELITVISGSSKKLINKIFSNDQWTITLHDKTIHLITYDDTLLDGNKYLYKGEVLDDSLKTTLQEIEKQLISDLIK